MCGGITVLGPQHRHEIDACRDDERSAHSHRDLDCGLGFPIPFESLRSHDVAQLHQLAVADDKSNRQLELTS